MRPPATGTRTALVGGATFRQDAQGRNRDAQPAQDRARSGRQARHRKLAAQRHGELRSGSRARPPQACAPNVEVRLSPAPTRFTRNADYRVRRSGAHASAARRSRCSTTKLDADGKATIREGPRPAARRARHAQCHLHHARVRARRRLQHQPRDAHRGGVRALRRAASCRRATPRATCCSPTPDTRWSSRRSNAEGAPVSVPRLQVTLYKVQWRWWWDSERRFAGAVRAGREHRRMIKQETVATKDGSGQWEFEIKYPEWGRYLVRACDLDGGHCTGRVFYIDWPSWAGAARDQSGPAANILMLTLRQAGVPASARPRWCSCPRPRRAARCSRSRMAAPFSSSAGSKRKPGANRDVTFRSRPAWRPTSTSR